MASSMAFFWAEEPSAFRVPVGQSDELELDEPPAASVPLLLSEPHAVRAMEPTTATLASRPRRWIFTVFKPLNKGTRVETRGGRGCPTSAKVGRANDAAARRGGTQGEH